MKKLAFQEYQLALTQHLRAPKDTERPDGTSKKRVGIYAELVYNNLNSFLESAFPVLRQILKKKRWKQLTRNFLRDHRSHSPLFRDIPKAFLDYLATLALAEQDLPPFTLELAHYEWLELAIDIHPQKVRWTKTRNIALDQPLRLNPALELVAYAYPVHQISPKNQPGAPAAAPYFLLVWRNQHHRVCFKTLSPQSAQLLHGLQQKQSPLQTAALLNWDASFTDEIKATLKEWLEEDIVVGCAR